MAYKRSSINRSHYVVNSVYAPRCGQGGAERLASGPQPRQIPVFQARRDPPTRAGPCSPPRAPAFPAATPAHPSASEENGKGKARPHVERCARVERQPRLLTEPQLQRRCRHPGPSTDSALAAAGPRRHRRRRRHGPNPRRRSRGRPCASAAGVCSVPGLPTRQARAGTTGRGRCGHAHRSRVPPPRRPGQVGSASPRAFHSALGGFKAGYPDPQPDQHSSSQPHKAYQIK